MSKLITQNDLNIFYSVNNAINFRYGINHEDLLSNNRRQDLVRARFIAFFILRHKFKMDFNLIGKLYNKDHTTVIRGIERMKKIGLKKEALSLTYPQYPQA